MKILVACEFSGILRDALLALGYDAISCDLEPSERSGPHYQGDVLDILDNGWDMMIAFPPCTYLSKAGARWWRIPEREAAGRDAMAFVLKLYNAPIPRVAIENPVGRLSNWWRKPDQIIQPWQFGESFSKQTCLWLKGLPDLEPTEYRYDFSIFIDNWSGVRDSRERSRTFPGIAKAMADQWTR